MPARRETPPGRPVERTGWREIGWFVLLWMAGVATISIVGLLIKWVIGT
ncbi:DUF2474 domain-containing protein [Pyruvatibacter mobilis]|jgi:hypothetical protein|uniref:DUF2474 domain-containing protein n=1 Tax=Pyruvatibacter mobilis TaxID=1712261 RepID=A0A845QDS3_9HYPH|nr:DUF2474 domain-containing protein [Pyruvatibacter mobilis]NBG96376.1 DUF2474 domain-containing protein [Pyruvatibacter mobilis]QJD75860.1 DUF2474 domain-containing protein [Pyruvatibacter mobilis]